MKDWVFLFYEKRRRLSACIIGRLGGQLGNGNQELGVRGQESGVRNQELGGRGESLGEERLGGRT
jgi:hypothetical protein